MVTPDVVVREARASDIPQLVELNALVQALHIEHRPDIFKPAESEEVAAWFLDGFHSGLLRGWVAKVDAQLIGSATVAAQSRAEHALCHARRWWEVDQLVVRAQWRRRGVARALLRAIAGEARQAGVREIQLSTWCFNSDAGQAWRKLGFEAQTVRFAADTERLTK
jgi:GNAT superfamily N-acetyltransferase